MEMNWRLVIFSDESSFELGKDTTKPAAYIPLIRLRRSKTPSEDHLSRRTVEHHGVGEDWWDFKPPLGSARLLDTRRHPLEGSYRPALYRSGPLATSWH